MPPALPPPPPPRPPPGEGLDAVHRQSDKNMDEAFVRNIARNRRIQEEKRAARDAVKRTSEATAQSETPSLYTPQRVTTDAVHRKIAKEMDDAFVKNVAKNRQIQDESRAARKAAKQAQDSGATSAKPTDNAVIASFNGRFREECLNVHWFQSLEDAKHKIDAFRWDYSDHHPHRALKRLRPVNTLGKR